MSNQSSAFTLITGANSGIGLELARQAAADGRNVVLVARNESTLESAANELKQRVSVHAVAEDLSQPGAAQRVFQRVGALNINVDCLINNAGLGDYGPFFKSDLAKQESIIGVNITALTVLTRLFLPAMVEQGRGNILNVASVAGFMPGPLMSVYFASKNYVLAFSEALMEELRGTGVKMTVLCPPAVRTNFSQTARTASANYMSTTKTTPAEVARYGYRMMQQGKTVAVYGSPYKLVTGLLVRFVPRFALRRLIHRANARGSY
ncbi:MAG: SDR family oxidoreductase [Candidatus Udaeobacter sp.]